MIGDRIRHFRVAAGLTLDEVVSRLSLTGATVTKQCLSKYEHGKSSPNADFLMRLGSVLNVTPGRFLEEPKATIRWLAFRKKSTLTGSQADRIRAVAQETVENHARLELGVGIEADRSAPELPRCHIETMEQAEEAAMALRVAWGLGEAPIESVTETVEDHGGIVVGVHDSDVKFDGLSGWVDDCRPLAVVNFAVSDDRRRFNLAHELGHLVMEERGPNEEALAHRFAAAFIVPRAAAIRELGAHRKRLNFSELGILKAKYGLSLQAWIRRAADLGIIDESTNKSMCIQVSSRGWRRSEPDEYHGRETPLRLRLLTLRALAEGFITREKAEMLCPGTTAEANGDDAAEAQLGTLRKLMRMPIDQRRRLLKAQAESAALLYESDPNLTDFEAFGEEDLVDAEPVSPE